MESHPAGARIKRWFLELSATRGKIVIVIPMGGAIVEPGPITWVELAAWRQVTGNRPNGWEIEQIMLMDKIYRAAVSAGSGRQRQDQGLGEYCGGKDVEECRLMFGNEDVLRRACSTCPS